MGKKTKLRYPCRLCDEVRFNSWQARDAHEHNDHRPPKKEEKTFLQTGKYFRLNNGIHLSVGSKISVLEEGIIEKIIITEGSNTAEVYLSITLSEWARKVEK